MPSQELMDRRGIKVEDCIHGHLYHISARNFNFGVYKADERGFVGIREKFGSHYLFCEYHWGTNQRTGTVVPLQDVDEYDGLVTHDDRDPEYDALFEWLKERVPFWEVDGYLTDAYTVSFDLEHYIRHAAFAADHVPFTDEIKGSIKAMDDKLTELQRDIRGLRDLARDKSPFTKPELRQSQ